MPEQALQVAFEIKTACDEISRRLLRWHWERKPGALFGSDDLRGAVRSFLTEGPGKATYSGR